MKKTHLFLLAAFGAALLGSCSSEEAVEEVVEEQSVSRQIVMSASDFINASDSRTSISTDYKFTWAENDTVGIFPDQGRQVDFPMVSGAGTNTASFNGGGWALKQSSNYAAYYPMRGEFYLDKTAIPVSFLGQKQIGNNSTAHLGKYDYMAASATTPVEGNVNFDFKHLVSLIEVDVTVPKAGNLTAISLFVDDSFFITKGLVDLTSQTPKIEPIYVSNTITIPLENVTVASGNSEVVKVYFMMAPVDFTGNTLKVSVAAENGVYSTTKQLGAIEAGKYYKLTVNDLKEPSVPSTVEWVDLGLSVKWASHNIGATKPEEYGDHFAWGEIVPKEFYTEENSLTYNKPMSDIAGDAQYDAATANWGTSARMPTNVEMQELVDNTTWLWTTTENGVNGYKVTSKSGNGNSIFLPAAGYREGITWYHLGESGMYWIATHNEFSLFNAYYLGFTSVRFDWNAWGNRDGGNSVRPVSDKK